MRKFLLVALIAISVLSCAKQDGAGGDEINGQNTVTLTLEQPESTKGVSDQTGAIEFAVIGSAKIYFIDINGVNIFQRELTAAEITALANDKNSAGGNTIKISGVPTNAKKLYFIANLKTTAGTTFPAVIGSGSSDARLGIDKLQVKTEDAPMSGLSSDFLLVSGNEYTTSVAITPIVARVELGQLTAINNDGVGQPQISGDITGFKLAGVYINHTRQDVLLSGMPYAVGSVADIRNQSGWSTAWATYFTSANTNFPFYNGGNPIGPTDWVANALVTHCTPTGVAALSFYPDMTNGATSTDPVLPIKQAWGYQVCPSAVVVAPAPADVPHLILKLTEMSYYDNPYGAAVQYLTVTKYKTELNAEVREFKRGNVYRITNLTFSQKNTTDQPYQQNINVTATVTVVPWVINNINPDWSI